MDGFIDGGASDGTPIKLTRDLLFRLTPIDTYPVLHEIIPNGTIGVVHMNTPLTLVVTFGTKQVVFREDQVNAYLSWDV